jgi:hypothetical protein
MDAKRIIAFISMIAIVIVAFFVIFPQDFEPSMEVTICDESHKEDYTYTTHITVNGIMIPQLHHSTRTVCDVSHQEPNASWDEWALRNGEKRGEQ